VVRLEQRHVLRPLALAVDEIATGLQSRCLELADDVIDRLLLGRSVDAAPLVGVRTERLDVLGEPGRRERAHVGRRGGWRAQDQRNRYERSGKTHRKVPSVWREHIQLSDASRKTPALKV